MGTSCPGVDCGTEEGRGGRRGCEGVSSLSRLSHSEAVSHVFSHIFCWRRPSPIVERCAFAIQGWGPILVLLYLSGSPHLLHLLPSEPGDKAPVMMLAGDMLLKVQLATCCGGHSLDGSPVTIPLCPLPHTLEPTSLPPSTHHPVSQPPRLHHSWRRGSARTQSQNPVQAQQLNRRPTQSPWFTRRGWGYVCV